MDFDITMDLLIGLEQVLMVPHHPVHKRAHERLLGIGNEDELGVHGRRIFLSCKDTEFLRNAPMDILTIVHISCVQENRIGRVI